MPPRYAYWTILIDTKPTAFRARDREELLPTLHQLRRKSPNVELRWFAHGRLWDTPEQAQWARRNVPKADPGARGRDWRPGGSHEDPRAKFKRKRGHQGAATGGRPAKPESRPQQAGGRPQKPWSRPHPSGRPLPAGSRPLPRADRPTQSASRPLPPQPSGDRPPPPGRRPRPSGSRPPSAGNRPPPWKSRPRNADRGPRKPPRR